MLVSLARAACVGARSAPIGSIALNLDRCVSLCLPASYDRRLAGLSVAMSPISPWAAHAMSVVVQGYGLQKLVGRSEGLDAMRKSLGTRFSKSPGATPEAH